MLIEFRASRSRLDALHSTPRCVIVGKDKVRDRKAQDCSGGSYRHSLQVIVALQILLLLLSQRRYRVPNAPELL